MRKGSPSTGAYICSTSGSMACRGRPRRAPGHTEKDEAKQRHAAGIAAGSEVAFNAHCLPSIPAVAPPADRGAPSVSWTGLNQEVCETPEKWQRSGRNDSHFLLQILRFRSRLGHCRLPSADPWASFLKIG